MSITPITGVNVSTINDLFSAMSSQQSQMTVMAKTDLSQGTDLYAAGNYGAAVTDIKGAIGLDPSAADAPQAYSVLAQTYTAQGDLSDAIKAYKTSLTISPGNDSTYISLGNIYYSQDDYSDAEKAYKAAVSISPTSSADLYSLGEAYLATGDTQNAQKTFQQVINMEPTQYGGYYALGQTYSKEGDQQNAIKCFEQVNSLDSTFYNVYVDLGSAYADLGQTNMAQNCLNILNTSSPKLAPVLSAYMAKVSKPKITADYSTTGFLSTLGPGTQVEELSPTLSSPNASTVMNMVFVFDKSMDANSVQNVANWTIGKSTQTTPGGAYDWGLSNPPTDTPVSPVPLNVVYLPDTDSAMVSFLITQNAGDNGTIDPSHINFQFNGTDTYGNAMDPKANEYNGVSQIV